MTYRKKIGIVGAGFSGMTAIIALKEEGHEPVCFEQTENPGGTWYYRDQPVENVASTMKSTILNQSKEIGAYSNYPPPAHCNNFMRQDELYKYFMDHWRNHDCLRHVHYKSLVVSVTMTEDYDETGRWRVIVKDTVTEELKHYIFDGVMVCVGHFTDAKMPSFPGQELFEGNILHSNSLKQVDELKGKNVVVVGTGCSGLDAAVEISNVANHVYLSTRSGAHILNRVGLYGNPMDTLLYRRVFKFMHYLPYNVASALIEKVWTDQAFHKDMYKVKPNHYALSKVPIINDYIFLKLHTGAVVQKFNIHHFTDKGVVFEGEEDVEVDVDVVVMATGYTWSFPFLDDSSLKRDGENVLVYKCVYPVHLKHPTLALIGFFLPFGPGFPPAELQCRWAARVFSEKCRLPDPKTMMIDIERRYRKNKARYVPNPTLCVQVDYIPYMDDLASQIGARPNFLKLLFTDIKLFKSLVFGPFLPYQFRLEGPYPWEGAREAILTCSDRIVAPLQGQGKIVGCFMLLLYILLKLLF